MPQPTRHLDRSNPRHHHVQHWDHHSSTGRSSSHPHPAMQPQLVTTTYTVAGPAPVSSPPSGTHRTFNASCARCLGATQIAIGGTCFILNCIAIHYNATAARVGAGIWCGLFFILVGAVGVSASRDKRTCKIIIFMVVSIIAVVFFMIALISAAALGLGMDANCDMFLRPDRMFETRCTEAPTEVWAVRKWTNGLMIGLALLEGIIAIISASICCAPFCCAGSSVPKPSSGQQVQGQGGQPIQYPAQVPHEQPPAGYPPQQPMYQPQGQYPAQGRVPPFQPAARPYSTQPVVQPSAPQMEPECAPDDSMAPPSYSEVVGLSQKRSM